MKQPDGSRNAPPAIIAILIGLVRPDVPRHASVDQQSDVVGFAVRQSSPSTTLLPVSPDASSSFYDLLISSVKQAGVPALDGAGKEPAY